MTYTTRRFALKREAEQYLSSCRETYGGDWTCTKQGRGNSRYVVFQTTTKTEKTKAEVVSRAQFTFDPRCDMFSSTESYASIYRQRDQLKKALDEWQTRFATNPSDALHWADNCLINVAEYTVVCQVITAHERGATDEQIADDLDSRARRSVDYMSLSRSSSPMSNLMERAEQIALAKQAKQMRSYVTARAEASGVLAAVAEGLY